MKGTDHNNIRLTELLQRVQAGEASGEEMQELVGEFKTHRKSEIDTAMEQIRMGVGRIRQSIDDLAKLPSNSEYPDQIPPQRGFELQLIEGGKCEFERAINSEKSRFECALTLIFEMESIYSDLEKAKPKPDFLTAEAYRAKQIGLHREAEDLEVWDHSRIERIFARYGQAILDYWSQARGE